MKYLLFMAAIIPAIAANAQNYSISFAGVGASSTVNTVKVENLTTGASLTLNGNDILNLIGTTGIDPDGKELSSGVKLYPNPAAGDSKLVIIPPCAGNAVITVFDMSGRQVARNHSFLDNSQQEFLLSGLNNGIYLIFVKGKSYHCSGKLLSNSNTYGNTVSIAQISSTHAIGEKQFFKDDKGYMAPVDMPYSTGEILKFTGVSGIYSTVVTDIPSSDKTIGFNFMACSDGDNNNYPVVEIGTQIWMAINLMTTKYGNGNLISTTVPANMDISKEVAPEYQWAYGGEESTAAVYGRLYTWYAVTDNLGVCPTGWHLPTDPEWTTLNNYLGGANGAGGKLKETGIMHWKSPNSGVTNETGFTALPGGGRISSGLFYLIGDYGIWWSATEHDAGNALASQLSYDNNTVSSGRSKKDSGYSVRCVRD